MRRVAWYGDVTADDPERRVLAFRLRVARPLRYRSKKIIIVLKD